LLTKTTSRKNKAKSPLSSPTENKGGLKIRMNKKGGFIVPDLSTHLVTDANQVYQLIKRGNKNRSVAATHQNSVSSRSHSILTLCVESGRRNKGKMMVVKSKLNLVDLAGSERFQAQSSERQKESSNINKSLNTLGNVIAALSAVGNTTTTTGSRKKPFVPYRDSALTKLLSDSLGGNSYTLMIANANMCDRNMGETLSTLRYATRAKKIQNKVSKNLNPNDAILLKLQEEINALKEMMRQKDALIENLTKGNSSSSSSSDHKTRTDASSSTMTSNKFHDNNNNNNNNNNTKAAAGGGNVEINDKNKREGEQNEKNEVMMEEGESTNESKKSEQSRERATSMLNTAEEDRRRMLLRLNSFRGALIQSTNSSKNSQEIAASSSSSNSFTTKVNRRSASIGMASTLQKGGGSIKRTSINVNELFPELKLAIADELIKTKEKLNMLEAKAKEEQDEKRRAEEQLKNTKQKLCELEERAREEKEAKDQANKQLKNARMSIVKLAEFGGLSVEDLDMEKLEALAEMPSGFAGLPGVKSGNGLSPKPPKKAAMALRRASFVAGIDSSAVRGWLMKRGEWNPSFKRRWCKVRAETEGGEEHLYLCYYKEKHDIRPRGEIHISSETKIQTPGGLEIHVKIKKRTYIFKAENEKDFKMWVAACSALQS